LKINNDVLAVLSQAIVNGNAVTLTGQLDRKLYIKTNEVLEAAGGKWNRKAKAHLFNGDATEIIEQIILTGEILIPQDFGYFPTPEPVVNRLMELAEIEPGMLVLEPSAGQGAIAREVAKIARVDCIELLQKNAEILVDADIYRTVVKGNFLETYLHPVYDRVVMNPPFERQADIKHVQHALKFLKPGGRLVSVMSASVTFRENNLTREFRELVSSRKGSIEALPEGSFKVSGTGVNTVIVTIF
jgi:predicted RNA methylase